MDIEKSSAVACMGRGICLSSPFFTRIDVPYLATGDGKRAEIEIGEAVEMACAGYLTYRWALVRKPVGSAAYLEEARLQRVDKPGVYVVTVTASGGWVRTLELCAFTAEQMYGGLRKTDELRLSVRGWLSDPSRTTEEIINRLETK